MEHKIKLRSCILNFSKRFEANTMLARKKESADDSNDGTRKDFFYLLKERIPNTPFDTVSDKAKRLEEILQDEKNSVDVYKTNESQILMHLGAVKKQHDLNKLIIATDSPVLEIKYSRNK